MARGRTRRLVGRLTRRAEFLAVAGTRRKSVSPGLILQVRRHDARQRPPEGEPALRVGYTASKKVGNSVARNRARRRLRAAVLEVLVPNAQPGHDFVVIARDATPGRPWDELRGDLASALRRLGVWREASA